MEKQSEDVVDGRAECMVNSMEILRGDTQDPFMFRLHYSQAFILIFHIINSFSLFKGNSC